jgi:hypothetical protein
MGKYHGVDFAYGYSIRCRTSHALCGYLAGKSNREAKITSS